MNLKIFSSTTALLGLAMSGMATASPPAWTIDKSMGVSLDYFPSRPDNGSKSFRASSPLLVNSPSWAPDITNIQYQGLVDLGFPLPPLKNSLQARFLIKLYRFPSGLDAKSSSEKILDPFLVRSMPGGDTIEQFASDSSHVVVKFSVVDESGNKNYSESHPFPQFLLPTTEHPQAAFDSEILYGSIYLSPSAPLHGNDEKTLAQKSATGVQAFRQAITALYEKVLTETAPDKQGRHFVDLRRCPMDRGHFCGVRVLSVPEQPLFFENYKSLPMPQDPSSIFLTSLLLLKSSDYAIHAADLDLSKLKDTNLDDLIGVETPHFSQILEVASVVDLKWRKP